MLSPVLGLCQFMLILGIGFALERRLKVAEPSFGYRFALSFGLGEIAVSIFLFCAGLVGGLRASVLIPASMAGCLVALPELKHELPPFIRKVSVEVRKSPFESIVVAAFVALYILGACVPEREEDSLWYHLAVPLHYITHGGRIQLVPYNLPSHYPMAVHLHYVFSLLVGNEMTAKVFMLCHWIPMLVLIGSVAKRAGLEKWGMFAIAVYLTCVHFRLPTMANVQRAVYLHAFLSTVFLWEYLMGARRRHLILASVFCGMAMATKLNAVLFCFAPQAVLLFLWPTMERPRRLVKHLVKVFAYGAIASVLPLPWFAKSYILTGSPTYPILGELFPPTPEFIGPMSINVARHGLNIPQMGNLKAFFHEILSHLDWLVHNSSDAILPAGLVASIVLLTWHPVRNKRLSALCMYVLFSLTILFFYRGADAGRLSAINYGFFVLVIAALLARLCHGVSSTGLKILLRQGVLAAFVLTVVYLKYPYLTDPSISWFGETAVTERARREWLLSHEVVPNGTFEMKQWVDEKVPRDDEIYVYGRYPFYLDRKCIFSDKYFGEQLDAWLDEGADKALEMLDAHEAKWVLVWQNDFGKWSKGPAYEFLENSARKVHREGGLVLYCVTSTDRGNSSPPGIAGAT